MDSVDRKSGAAKESSCNGALSDCPHNPLVTDSNLREPDHGYALSRDHVTDNRSHHLLSSLHRDVRPIVRTHSARHAPTVALVSCRTGRFPRQASCVTLLAGPYPR